MPIKMCGGGHASTWHIDTIYYTYNHHQHNRCRIPCYKVEDLRIDHQDLENIDNEKRHRLLIALGLAMTNGPDILGFPDQMQMDNDNNVERIKDLEEIQKMKYGD